MAMTIWAAGGIGFMIELIGISSGVFLLTLLNVKSRRLQGMMMGLAAGLMMAIICFDVLPEAFEKGGVIIALLGMIGGLGIGLSLDDVASHFTSPKTGVVLTIGVALHAFPEGIALGTLLAISPQIGIKVALIVLLHSIPEGMAIAISLQKNGVKEKTLGAICVMLAGIMSVGAMTGFAISALSPTIVTLIMGFAAGIILYVVCEELIPESKEVWNGRLTTIAVVFGIMIGIIMTMGI